MFPKLNIEFKVSSPRSLMDNVLGSMFPPEVQFLQTCMY